MSIYHLAFFLFFQSFVASNQAVEFSASTYDLASEQKQKRVQSGNVNIVLKSTDGGQTWQDINEGLSGKLEEGGFSVSRKIRICEVFYRQDPGADTKYFCCTNIKRIRKIKEMS
jgi:photosystem II stability/assembly factor-like uncharacterized protein